MTPAVRDGFRAGSYTFRFSRNPRGRIDGMTVDAFDVHGMRWKKVRVVAHPPSE